MPEENVRHISEGYLFRSNKIQCVPTSQLDHTLTWQVLLSFNFDNFLNLKEFNGLNEIQACSFEEQVTVSIITKKDYSATPLNRTPSGLRKKFSLEGFSVQRGNLNKKTEIRD